MTAAATVTTGFTTRPDPWLSGLLGRPALNLVKSDQPSGDWKARLAAEDLFVSAKVAADKIAEASLLQDIGFRMIDTALTFEGAPAPTVDPRVRFARPEDRAAVVRIAGTSFVHNRFHLDPLVPDALANKIKAAWAENFFTGARGGGMVVAEQEGAVVGFLLLLWADDVLVIDLIAVAPQAARRGLAGAMIGFAASNGSGDVRRPQAMRVGTQAVNVPSVRLYESLGLRLTQAQLVLHHHGRGGPYRESA